MTEYILTARNVLKSYNGFIALDNFECEIPKGVTGLLGPNGAGKTTFIRTLLGIHPFSKGEMTFYDWTLPRDINKAKDFIGYQPELPTQIKRTSAIKYVSHMCRMSGLPREAAIQRAFDTLHYVGLEEARYRNMEDFSQGMLQKVKLATALVHDPLLLILDEPTAGCDPRSRDQILSLIEDLGRNHEKNILISTHLLPDIERTANYVVIMNKGKNIKQGKLVEIIKKTKQTVRIDIRTSSDHHEFANAMRKHDYQVIGVDNNSISCVIDRTDTSDFHELFELAKSMNSDIRMINEYKPTLEDVFLEILNVKSEEFS